MTQGVPFSGKDLRLMRKSGPTDDTPSFLCTVTTKDLTRTWEYEDATMPDCDNPSAVPPRRSLKKSSAWSVNASGIADARSYRDLDAAAADPDTPMYVRILVAKPAASGGGHWDGAVWFENLKIESQDMGVVKFSAQMRGEGPLTWTNAAAAQGQ
ncbi:phage tail tube protein [Methylobacterium sp. JK268]